MSLEKKIILSFLISSAIIAILAISGYVNFVEIRKEIRYLELSDTVRSKSLQLRRHEKNFFLYGDIKEKESVHAYLIDLKLILKQGKTGYNTGKIRDLEDKIYEYEQRFKQIEVLFSDLQAEFARLTPFKTKYSVFLPLIESTVLERPLVNAEVLKKVFLLHKDDPVIKNLYGLNTEINSLRKWGEEILNISKDIDKSAREKVEKTISFSQSAILILFPLFLFVGLGALFVISHSVVKRLKILTYAVEKTGKGDFSSVTIPSKQDEIGFLITAFNKMELDLINRNEEIVMKNEELLQSRKLASIGTLASGVAHELNNPLNNIYLAAQILSKEIKQESYSEIIKDTVGDIFSQTLRVKRIVSDLLEFSRQKPPELTDINVAGIIKNILNQMAVSGEILNVRYNLDAPDNVGMHADRHLIEQVFINIFSNAIDAMEGNGLLNVTIKEKANHVVIKVSDTGKGISADNIQRVFDPFFTTKEKGTGLGLAIVYSIIEKHRGKIDISITEGKGTTFIITLPE